MKIDKTAAWILGGIVSLAIFVGLGGRYAMSKIQIAKIEGDAADRYGFPRWWFVALGLQETGLNPSRINMTGGDAARGGAWGVNQITIKTARKHGFTGEPKELLDPIKNADWTGRILSNPLDRWDRRRPPPKTFAEAASMWNGGFYPGDKPPEGGKPIKDETLRQVAAYVEQASGRGGLAETLV